MTSFYPWLLGAHVASTWALVGLIWSVQVLVYPQFQRVGTAEFGEYHHAHMSRVTWIVAPLMFAELITQIALIVVARQNTGAAVTLSIKWLVLGAALVGVNWLSTAFIQVPLHNRLAHGFDSKSAIALVHTNWIRTISWSCRGVLTLVLWEETL